ncbi:hypothetical protein [Rhodococcus sp. 008]|uniref:hypothetical protein n=1 Tax=Rhodococcus sp. 008 TaxID=1723645 RepID=UPI0008063FEC|nr:hypothetical protein [Rhodococcus sp. 008]ANQ73195.1 hypothetical protein AOT96_21855 [Rhodococcus sp. 008]
MSNLSEDIIRTTLLGVANTLGVRIDIPDETIADLAATLQTEIDRLEAVETESFEFLNELALAFRAAENHPRPQYAPVLEGIRAVLAHLTAAGRLLAADEQRLTAEQVEDVRAAREGLRGYRNFDGNARGHVNRLIAAVDALFPATEPAEDFKPSQSIDEAVARVWRAFTPAPAVPAEEETKAEDYCCHPKCRWSDWGGINRKHERGADCPIVPKPTSSPVVPAPTETGPWPSLNDVPAEVAKVRDSEGFNWRRVGRRSWEGQTTQGRWAKVNNPANFDYCAPFVAAEEG